MRRTIGALYTVHAQPPLPPSGFTVRTHDDFTRLKLFLSRRMPLDHTPGCCWAVKYPILGGKARTNHHIDLLNYYSRGPNYKKSSVRRVCGVLRLNAHDAQYL